jgi:hypothetical protein
MEAYVKEKKQGVTSPFKLFIFLITVILALAIFLRPGYVKVIMISNQETGVVYLSEVVEYPYRISYGWIHSFENIPWTEDYIINEDNSLLLKRIKVAGFGAGIPNNKGIVSIDDNGMIIMDKIDQEFPKINWINSNTALEYIKVNGEILITGSELPHHEFLELEVKERVKLWIK